MLDWTGGRAHARDCRCVELRALCNEVPRTPPGPEGSNGNGKASGAADHPKFLAFKPVSFPFWLGRIAAAAQSWPIVFARSSAFSFGPGLCMFLRPWSSEKA